MNKAHFQDLARERLREAKVLLAGKRWSGAYYLAGYAIECVLKACILARIERTGEIFKERKFAERCWTHDPRTLMDLADLLGALEAEIATNPALEDHWRLVKDWSENSRYQKTARSEAKALYNAITDKTNGIMPWITNHS